MRTRAQPRASKEPLIVEGEIMETDKDKTDHIATLLFESGYSASWFAAAWSTVYRRMEQLEDAETKPIPPC